MEDISTKEILVEDMSHEKKVELSDMFIKTCRIIRILRKRNVQWNLDGRYMLKTLYTMEFGLKIFFFLNCIRRRII